MIETQSREAMALRILKLRKPVTVLVAALAVYATLGLPALCYQRVNMIYSRCITLTGERIEISGDAPAFFFIKDGKITWPRR